MTNEEIFRAQWDTLAEVMISMINTELESVGIIDFTRLDEVYRSKIVRWSSRSTTEGRWMNGLGDAKAVPEVRSALSRLRLTEVAGVNSSSAIAPLGGWAAAYSAQP